MTVACILPGHNEDGSQLLKWASALATGASVHPLCLHCCHDLHTPRNLCHAPPSSAFAVPTCAFTSASKRKTTVSPASTAVFDVDAGFVWLGWRDLVSHGPLAVRSTYSKVPGLAHQPKPKKGRVWLTPDASMQRNSMCPTPTQPTKPNQRKQRVTG